MEYSLKKYVAKSLSEYVSIATKIANNSDGIWFRGHANASYRLVPSALRNTPALTDARGNKVEDGQIVISEGGEVTPEFKSEVRHFLFQATKHISLKTIAGCLNPRHFFGR
jgi:hypothetical protein